MTKGQSDERSQNSTCTFGNHQIVVLTDKGRVGEKLGQSSEKRQVCFTDGANNHRGTAAGICKYQSKIQCRIPLEYDAIVFLDGGCGNTGRCD